MWCRGVWIWLVPSSPPKKAKTAKMVRTVIDIVCEAPGALEVQMGLCEQVVAWCLAEKRSFLRQRVQTKLAGLMLKAEKYTEALSLVSKLIKELKKLDDKQVISCPKRGFGRLGVSGL